MTTETNSAAGAALESVLNRAFALDPDAARRLRALAGRVLLLELTGGSEPYRIYVLPTTDGIRLARTSDASPDVAIAGPASVFLRQLVGGPTVSGELVLRGDIELGQQFQRILSSFRPDWEEGLARVVGDIPAHQIGRVVRGLRSWARHAGQTLGADVSEYLQEEARLLATRERVEKFMRAVDGLRADVDRLEKRVQRLGDAR